MQNETRRLNVHLSDSEIECRGRELATCLINIGKLEEQKKALSQTIKPIKERATLLSLIIEEGIEPREVDCAWDYHWATGKKTLYRIDTGEELETEEILEHEKQQHFA